MGIPKGTDRKPPVAFMAGIVRSDKTRDRGGRKDEKGKENCFVRRGLLNGDVVLSPDTGAISRSTTDHSP